MKFSLPLISLLLLLSGYQTLAQGVVCGMPADDPPGCLLDTSILRGQTTGYTNNPLVASLPGQFCTNVFHDAWVEFVPLCEEVSFVVKGLSCIPRLPTYGILLSVLDENYQPLQNCYPFQVGGIAFQKFFVEGLTPGRRYFLLIFADRPGTNCQYGIEAKGVATFGMANPFIHGVFQVGAGSRTKFYVELAPAGTTYVWNLQPGLDLVSGQGTRNLTLQANIPGAYEICCTLTPPAGNPVTYCDTVMVSPNGNIYQYEFAQFCKGSCYPFHGECLDEGGTYYHVENGVVEVLELCRYPEPRVAIYGGDLINFQQADIPADIQGYVRRGTGNYRYRWLNSNGVPYPNATNTYFTVILSGQYCFEATDLNTGCADTACTEVVVTSPLPDPCGVAGDEPPGCAICGPIYIGSTLGYTPNIRPPGFCGTIENNQWLAFVAGSTTASVSITSWNCQNSDGVQLYMLDLNLVPVSSCFSSGGNNVPGQITANGLTPGEVYLIMIDGFAGDICDFQISVVGGITTGPPDEPTQIRPPNDEDPCPGQVVCYTLPQVNGATNYAWSVMGDGRIVVGQGSNQVCIEWGSAGQGSVCVTPYNPCFVGVDTCIDVRIVEKGTLHLPPIYICASDFPLTDQSYCITATCPSNVTGPGTYCVVVANNTGCDSVVCYTFAEKIATGGHSDTTLCVGDCLVWYNQILCDAGTYYHTLTAANGCDSAISVTISRTQPEAFIANPPDFDCETGQPVVLDGSGSTSGPGIHYLWTALNTGTIQGPNDQNTVLISNPGTYILKVSNGPLGSCADRDTVNIPGSISPPLINCISTGDEITFSWDPVAGAVHYDVEINGSYQGRQDSTTFSVGGLVPSQVVTIGVQANGILGCGSSASSSDCQALNCPQVTISIDTVPNFCRDGSLNPLQLQYTAANALGGGTAEWFGPGVSPDGVFDPEQANTGSNLINLIYTEGPCSYIGSRRIRVFEPPSSDFEVDSVICVTDFATITYTGTGASSAQYNWDFANGLNLNNGTGNGPYQIQWPSGGLYNIQLEVEANGCPGLPVNRQVQVEMPLPKPVLECATSTNTIIFSWDDVPDADHYEVHALEGPAGNLFANSYTVGGLTPGVLVSVELVAEGSSSCGPSRDTLQCVAKPCPVISVSLDPVDPICVEPSTPPLDLNPYLRISGQTSAAQTYWSGGSYIDSSGLFQPFFAGPGLHRVIARVEEEGCKYSDTIQIQIFRTPLARFFATPFICQTDTVLVSFNGSAPNGTVYHWDFGSGNELTGNLGFGPFALSWASPGLDTLQLSLQANGCISDTVRSPVRIDAPIPDFGISCISTIDGISFSWDDLAAITDFNWTLADTPSMAQLVQTDPFSLQISGLNPNQSITLMVDAIDSLSVCPANRMTLTCETSDCPQVQIQTTNPPSICLQPDTNPIDLNGFLQLSGNLSQGNRHWSGIGTDSLGNFDPRQAGPGMHTLYFHFNEYTCQFSDSLTVTVYPLPISDAGTDQTFTCYDTTALLGGPGNFQNPPSVIYLWSGGPVNQPGSASNSTHTAGIYTLTVQDTLSGCTSTDEVEVKQGGTPPVLLASVQEIRCFGEQNGVIAVDGIQGGTPPFVYSLNRQPFSDQSIFENLGPGIYEVRVEDAEGCEDAITFRITEPGELVVELVVYADADPIPYGDSVWLQAITNYAPELLQTVSWTPEEQFPPCDETNLGNCLSFYVTPTGRTVYTIRIESLNGCVAEDALELDVENTRGVYIPSGFSPGNQDGINDVFRIYGNPKIVTNVRSFLIFDRWGELVFENYNFQIEDDSHGWNGMFRGKSMQSGVFAYFAEVEFYDGTVEFFKGDVTLKR